MKIEMNDELLARYKRIIVKGGLDAPVTKKEWTDEIEEIIQYRIEIEKVKKLIDDLKDWLEDCDYKDMFQILEELKDLEATLSTYLEDITRMEE